MKIHCIFVNDIAFRRPGYRKKNYADAGMYYVTICTKNRVPWFGEIINGRMELSDVGRIAHECWQSIPNHFSHVRLDRFIIMPDHMHGIIRIMENINVETPYMASLPRNEHHKPQWKRGCLGSIVQQFKRACTVQSHKMGLPDFAWQPRYYDHVIRDRDDLERIRWYIEQNPSAWERDHPR